MTALLISTVILAIACVVLWFERGRAHRLLTVAMQERDAALAASNQASSDFWELHHQNVRLTGERDEARAELATIKRTRSDAGVRAGITRKARRASETP